MGRGEQGTERKGGMGVRGGGTEGQRGKMRGGYG